MNDEILNNYNRLISSSQETMRDVITIINHQESTLRRILNSDYEDTITTLRNENAELRRRMDYTPGPILPRMNQQIPRMNQQLPRMNQQLPRMNQPWSHPEIRPHLQSNEPISINRNTRQPPRNPNVNVLPNNQDQYMARYLTNIPDLIFGTIGQGLTSVVVRPTDRQVREATQLVRFENIIDPQNSSCPISLERFTGQQLVTRIIFCGHIFSTNELQTWFETNVRCPLCRFDIREHRNQSSINNNEPEPMPEPMPEPEIDQSSENHNDQYDELFNSISRNIDGLLRNADDLSSNLSDDLVRTIINNIHSLPQINHNNITETELLDIFNNDPSFNFVTNIYSDTSSNVV
jgi:hypothetical protein